MKSNGHSGFDGLDESCKMLAAADDDLYEGSGHLIDDVEEDEEEIVTMTSDDDEEMLDEADDLLDPHAEEAIIASAPPSPIAGYTPAETMSKLPEPSSSPVARVVAKKAAKKSAPAKGCCEEDSGKEGC